MMMDSKLPLGDRLWQTDTIFIYSNFLTLAKKKILQELKHPGQSRKQTALATKSSFEFQWKTTFSFFKETTHLSFFRSLYS